MIRLLHRPLPPPPPSPVSKLSIFLSSCVSPVELTDGIGGGGGGRGCLVLYNSFNTLWTGRVDYVSIKRQWREMAFDHAIRSRMTYQIFKIFVYKMVTVLEEVSLTMVDFLYVVSTSLGIHEKIRQNVHVVGGFLGFLWSYVHVFQNSTFQNARSLL
jgi:hypothetical protein